MKQAFIHYGGYLLSAAGAVAGVSLLSHFVSPDQYGRVALYIAIGTLFQYVVRESLGAAILRYSEKICQDKSTVLQLSRQSLPQLAMVFIVVVIPAFFYLQQSPVAEFVTGMFLVLLLGMSAAGETFLSALHKRTACAVHVNLLQWLRFLLAAVFYIFIEQTVFAILAGFTTGFLLAVLFDIAVYRSEKPSPSCAATAITRDNIFAGNTAIAIGFLAWFLAFYERIALEWFYGETYLGVYFVLYQIGFMPVVMLMRSVATYLFPRLFINGAIDLRHLHKTNVLLTLSAIFLAFGILQLLHEWLFSWLVGASYREYSWLLPWLFLAAMLNACSYLLQGYYYEKDAIKKLLVIKSVAAIACLILVSLLVWKFAIQGLIAASVIVSFMLIVMSYHAINKSGDETVSEQ